MTDTQFFISFKESYLPKIIEEILHYYFSHSAIYVLCFRELQLLRLHSKYSVKTFNKKQIFLDILNCYFEAAYVDSAQIVYTVAYFGLCRRYMMEPSCIINQRLVANIFYMKPNFGEGDLDIHAPFP